MGVREDRLAKWPVEVYVNEMRSLGVKTGFKDVEDYVKENGYLIDMFYTGHSASQDELPKLLIEVDKLKIPAGPIAVAPHVHHHVAVFTGADREQKVKRAMALARPVQLERLRGEVYASQICAKAILTDDEYDAYEKWARRARSFIKGYLSLVPPGYEVTRQNNMMIFSVLDGIKTLRSFTTIINPMEDKIQLIVRVHKATSDTPVGTFESTYEDGQNAWKLITIHITA